MTNPEYVLIKRGLYWRPNSQGYTGLLVEAGLYSLAEAKEAMKGESTYMLASEAPLYAPKCCEDIKVADQAKRQPANFVAQWQPIETAPKDGTKILCCCMKTSERQKAYMGWMAVDFYHHRPEYRYEGWANFNSDHWAPTYWMPLPPLPEIMTEGGQ